MMELRQKTALLLLMGTMQGFFAAPVQAAIPPSLEEEIRWLQEEHYVTTATKTRERLRKSGSTMTVLTADDLRNMGARDLMDALKRVPGFGVNRFNMGFASVEVRGVKTDFSEKILFLVNGHPINNNLVNGGALVSYDNFPVDDIKVVEILRGPGSALYGANAFVAVVNIVTDQAEDVAGTELSVRAGSNETNRFNLQHGSQMGEVAVAFNANVYHSDGWRGEVDSDVIGQSGTTDYWQQRYDFGFNAEVGDFGLQARYVKRQVGAYLGANNVLNDDSRQEYVDYFIEGSHSSRLFEDGQLSTTIYFDHFEFDNLWEIFPEGYSYVDPLLGPVTFPDGLITRSPINHDKSGFEVQYTWYGLEQHKLVSGFAFEHQTQYGVEHWSNNGSGPLVDISENANWNGSHSRNIRALYLQDIWDPTQSLRVIMGGRYDDYSDFGATFNPRVSVSWELKPSYQLIATYGSAFRAPTFGELYNINNNAIVGNPEVEPEEIETTELGMRADIGKRSRLGATLFYNNIVDIIAPRPQPNGASYSDNIGELTVQGIELEINTRLEGGSTISANYTYQDPRNERTDARAPDVPLHRANLMFNYRYSRQWNAFAGLHYESTLAREVGDNRSEVPEQTGVDLALNWRSLDNVIQVTGSLYNLTDEDLVDPAPGALLSDYPQPGRTFMLELTLREPLR